MNRISERGISRGEKRPEVWGTDHRVTIAGAVILADGATVALEGPLLLVVHWLYRLTPLVVSRAGSSTRT